MGRDKAQNLYFPIYFVVLSVVTASTLKGDLTSHYGKVLGKDDDLRRRIQAFASCSEATISMLKRKYDELRIDFEQLKLHSNPDPTSFPARPEQQTTSLGTIICF